jgi:hypothetical protein
MRADWAGKLDLAKLEASEDVTLRISELWERVQMSEANLNTQIERISSHIDKVAENAQTQARFQANALAEFSRQYDDEEEDEEDLSALLVQDIQHGAASTIQSRLRGNRLRKELHSEGSWYYQRLTQQQSDQIVVEAERIVASMDIQRCFRGWMTRQSVGLRRESDPPLPAWPARQGGSHTRAAETELNEPSRPQPFAPTSSGSGDLSRPIQQQQLQPQPQPQRQERQQRQSAGTIQIALDEGAQESPGHMQGGRLVNPDSSPPSIPISRTGSDDTEDEALDGALDGAPSVGDGAIQIGES